MKYYAHITKHRLNIDCLSREYTSEVLSEMRVVVESPEQLKKAIKNWENGGLDVYIVKNLRKLSNLPAHGNGHYEYFILEETK